VAGVVTIDLNSDLGESFGSWTMGADAEVLTLVSSANVACGFHAGDPSTLRRTCTLAAEAGVSVGAHVAYRDLAGFGRRFLDVHPEELTDEVIYQIGALQAMAAASGTSVRYVKPHGALYTAITHHEGQAAAVVAAVLAVDPTLPVVVLPGTVMERAARDEGLRTVPEAFADRAYTADGRLVPRGAPGAVIHDPEEAASRAVRIATEGTVEAITGEVVTLRAETVCVHGDTPGAVAIAAAVRQGLGAAGVTVTSFR
jgi:UPF0271 protein